MFSRPHPGPDQPRYLVAHRTNHLAAVAAALAAGANGVEIDLSLARAEPEPLRVGHGPLLSPGTAPRSAPALPEFLAGLRALAAQQSLALVYFDCKARFSREGHARRLFETIRREWSGHPDTPAGMQSIISFPHVASLQRLDLDYTRLHPQEIIMVDQETDYERVRNYFQGVGVTRYGYGNGSSVAQRLFSRLVPSARRSLAQACRDRDAGTGPHLVGVCTVNHEAELRACLDLGVNLIMADLHPPFHCPGPGLSALVRLSGRTSSRPTPTPTSSTSDNLNP